MDETMGHTCDVCGGTEFLKDSGFFYCIECQTQCQGICEQVFEDQEVDHENEERIFGTPFVAKKTPKGTKTKKKGDDFTSWEMLNFVLRGLVEELISAGAPPSLRDTVLQLWVYYLQKLEVAFISKDECLLPKLGVKYYKSDATLLFGLKKKKLTKRPKGSSINAELNTTVQSLTDWCSMEIKKKWKRKAKKALMDKITETSMVEMDAESSILDQSINSTDLEDANSIISSDSTSTLHSSSSNIFHRSAKAKDWLAATGKGDLAVVDNLTDPLSFRRSRLLVILYLALLYEGSHIQISDILRWIREGHLSYFEASRHLPEGCYIQGMHHYMFVLGSTFLSYEIFYQCAKRLAGFLEMVDWPKPDLLKISQKYVKELHLPDIFAELILRVIALVPKPFSLLSEKYTVPSDYANIPNYEGRILAILIVIMKMLLGLDGKTEHKISNSASRLNKCIEQGRCHQKATKLFVWDNWVKQLICRNAVISSYHFPTKQTFYSGAYENPNNFMSYLKKWHNANGQTFQEKYNFYNPSLLKACHPALLNTFQCILEKLQTPNVNNADDIDFPQSFTPYSLYIKNIIERSCALDEPLISETAMEIFAEDFSKCDVNYLLTPDVLSNITARRKHLKIKKKSAQKKFTKLQYKSPQSYVGTTQCYVSVILGNKLKNKVIGSDDEEYLRERERRLKLRKASEELRRNLCNNEFDKVRNRILNKCNGNAKMTMNSASKSNKKKVVSLKSKKKKSSKSLKFYIPCKKYWVGEHNLKEREFEFYVLPKFPFSFAWLLTECSLVSEMTVFHIYKEVVQFEILCRKFLK